MKNNIFEACVSFFGLVFWAVVFALAVLLCMLLMPFVVLALIVLTIREAILWTIDEWHLTHNRTTTAKPQQPAMIRPLSPKGQRRTAA